MAFLFTSSDIDKWTRYLPLRGQLWPLGRKDGTSTCQYEPILGDAANGHGGRSNAPAARVTQPAIC